MTQGGTENRVGQGRGERKLGDRRRKGRKNRKMMEKERTEFAEVGGRKQRKREMRIRREKWRRRSKGEKKRQKREAERINEEKTEARIKGVIKG